MKKIILLSFTCVAIIASATSCSKTVKAPASAKTTNKEKATDAAGQNSGCSQTCPSHSGSSYGF